MSDLNEWLKERRTIHEAATIPGFPHYEVDVNGTVWSTRNWRGYGRREITPVETNGGYLKVRLSTEGDGRVNRAVHRIVAETFLGPRPGGAQIRHLNGDKKDNRAENLAWGTALENAGDREMHGNAPIGIRNPHSKLTDEDVSRIRSLHAEGRGYADIGRLMGIHKAHVRRIVLRINWGHVPTVRTIEGASDG